MSSQKRPVQQSTYSLNGQPRRHPPPGGRNESGPSSRAICERRRERGDLNAAAALRSKKEGCGHLLPLFCPGSPPRSGSSSFFSGDVSRTLLQSDPGRRSVKKDKENHGEEPTTGSARRVEGKEAGSCRGKRGENSSRKPTLFQRRMTRKWAHFIGSHFTFAFSFLLTYF